MHRVTVALTCLALAAVVGAYFAVQALSPATDVATTPCAGADQLPRFAGDPETRATMLCLINSERARASVRAVRSEPHLEQAASSYARRMVNERFFSHTDPLGGTLPSRVFLSGYLAGADLWLVGENLSWGGGTIGTPRKIIAALMLSPAHRVNMLGADYTDVGIGIVPGTPTGGASGATHAQLFGMRSMRKITKKKPKKKPKKQTKTRR